MNMEIGTVAAQFPNRKVPDPRVLITLITKFLIDKFPDHKIPKVTKFLKLQNSEFKNKNFP